MNGIDKIKEQVIECGKELLQKGLIARTWGNVSARISEKEFVITPSGRGYDTLTLDDIVTVRIKDESYTGDIKPSSEKGIHAAVYAMHPEAKFIIHTHQNFATALSVQGEGIRGYDKVYRDVLGDFVPCSAYALSGTKAIKANAIKEMKEHPKSWAFLLRNHGAVIFGTDKEDAMKKSLALEEVSQKRYFELTGIKPTKVSDPSKILEKETPEGAYVLIKTPFVKLLSAYGTQKRVYVDDEAQYLGNSVRCIGADKTKSHIYGAVRRYKAVYVEGKGAVVFGPNIQEADALRMVLEKGALCAYLALNTGVGKPVDFFSAIKEHRFYVNSYSKLKDQGK